MSIHHSFERLMRKDKFFPVLITLPNFIKNELIKNLKDNKNCGLKIQISNLLGNMHLNILIILKPILDEIL